MGQQQILLVILVTIIIGVATVVAINTMEESRTQSNKSAMRQDILMIMNDARVYYEKPQVLGGGGKSFDTISKEQILAVDKTNENAKYTISGSGKTVTVEGESQSSSITLTATGKIEDNNLDITWSESTE